MGLMPRFLADENFDGPIIRGLLARELALDLIRVQDIGFMQTPDPVILEWAAGDGRVLLTQDRKTMAGFALNRVATGLPMPGVVVVRPNTPIRQAIDDLLVLALASDESDLPDRVWYVPLLP